MVKVGKELHHATHQVGRSDKWLAYAGDIEVKMTKQTDTNNKRTAYMYEYIHVCV